MEYLQLIITGLSVVAAILAWVAKLRWSKEFADAKEASIAAKDVVIQTKDAQIQLLERQVETFKELSSVKLREYNVALKTGLEEYIDQLKSEIGELRTEIEAKDLEVGSLSKDKTLKEEEITKIKAERDELEQKANALETSVNQIVPVAQRLGSASISPDDLAAAAALFINFRATIDPATIDQIVQASKSVMKFLDGRRGLAADNQEEG